MTESPRVALQAAATVFVVKDVGESVAHYQNVLGFHVEFTDGSPACCAGLRDHGS
jgi:hypothetical protein